MKFSFLPARNPMTSSISLTAGALLLFAGSAAIAGGDVEAGKEKSAQCAACHGPTGVSQDPNFPIIAGQYADYLIKALEDYKSGARKNPIMAGFAAGLSQRDREDLAAFYSRQKSPLRTIDYAQ